MRLESSLSDLNIKNWVDAAGFGGKDLAINGVESFDLLFGQDHQSVGLAIITGTGLFPNEVDLNGATFEFKAFDASSNLVGTATHTLSTGVDSDWITLNSTTAFSKLEVRELGAASIADQYFSDILTSVEQTNPASDVPEPTSLAIFALGGLALAANSVRRRNRR